MAFHLQVADKAVGVESGIAHRQFVEHNLTAEQRPQLHTDGQMANVGQRVALMNGAELVDAQIERPFQVDVPHADLHARLIRSNGRHFLYGPVLHWRYIKQGGQYDEK